MRTQNSEMRSERWPSSSRGCPADMPERPRLSAAAVSFRERCRDGWPGFPQPVAQAKVGNDVRIERQGHALAQWTLETPALRTRLLGSCEPDDPDAVRIALALDWDDCLETIIEAETVELTAARGKAVLRVAGRPRITHVVHVDRFQGRVTELTDVEVDSIPDSATARLPAKRTRKRTTK